MKATHAKYVYRLKDRSNDIEHCDSNGDYGMVLKTLRSRDRGDVFCVVNGIC